MIKKNIPRPSRVWLYKKTYEEVKLKDQTVTDDDVNKMCENNIDRKTQMKGYNSFIAHEAKEEQQMDLVFFFDLKDPEYYGGLLMVDIFTHMPLLFQYKTTKLQHD